MPTEKNSIIEDLLEGLSWPEGQIWHSLPCSQLAAGYCGVTEVCFEVFLGRNCGPVEDTGDDMGNEPLYRNQQLSAKLVG